MIERLQAEVRKPRRRGVVLMDKGTAKDYIEDLQLEIKRLWHLTDIVNVHQIHLKEIVEKTNQLIDNVETMNNFVNSLVTKINDMNEEIMELARKVYSD